METRRIRLLVVDDHSIVREGLCSILRAEPDVQVGGEGVLDEKAASPVLERLRRGAKAPVHLTEREITLLKLTAEGMTNKEIGQQLYLSEATVKDQLRKIMDKLGVDHRISAVIAAI